MTDNNHPITPPDDLQEQWKQEWLSVRPSFTNFHQWMLAKSAQWGADQELEACIAWFDRHIPGYELVADRLREARRPKPPSLKEQAWKLLECYGTSGVKLTADQCNTIREALEELSND